MTESRAEALQALEGEVAALLRRVKQFVTEQADAVHPGLPPTAYYILAWLNENGQVRPSVLADYFQLDKGAVSRQLHHLIDLGFVEHAPDPADGRAMLVSVSPEGARQLASATERRLEWLEERMGEWSPDEMRELIRVLAKYNAALE